MKRNDKSLFFRLTVVVSFPVFYITVENAHYKASDLEVFTAGVIGVCVLWGIYWRLRWIYNGFRK